MVGGEQVERAVEIHTTHGVIEGQLHVAPCLRTLDDLNLVAKNFVTVHAPKTRSGSILNNDGPLAINKHGILFVRELKQMAPRAGGSFGRFTKAALLLQVGGFDIHGFVHVPPGGQPLKRFDHDGHPFVSLTSVLVSGPDGELTTEFLAVNRAHVLTAQQSCVAEPALVE